ncbi:MAG: four helix bundle protein [Bacteroidetes bacterium]|nr:four helix bundle protein [Bacteroidota bacterium]
MPKSYQDLDVWKESRQFVKLVYKLSRTFPNDEIYGLTQQMRRAAVSQFANISEGLGRRYKKETVHFLPNAKGSLYELEAEIIVALDQNYLTDAAYNDIRDRIGFVLRLVNGTIKYFENAKLS